MAGDEQRLRNDFDLAMKNRSLQGLSDAIYHAGEGRHYQFAPLILQIADANEDKRVLENAAWALGKLGYAPAKPALLPLLGHPQVAVVRGAAWALGELGAGDCVGPLRDAYDRCDDEKLRQIIGGALKKLAGRTTRAPAQVVARRLQPPPSPQPNVTELVARLEALEFPEQSAEVLNLRQQLQRLDSAYFQRYMRYRAQRPAAIETLKSNRVYGSGRR